MYVAGNAAVNTAVAVTTMERFTRGTTRDDGLTVSWRAAPACVRWQAVRVCLRSNTPSTETPDYRAGVEYSNIK